MGIRNRKNLYAALGLIWLVVIAFAGLLPIPPGTKILSELGQQFPWPKVATRVIQAIIHGILFGVWAVLIARLYETAFPALKSIRALGLALATVLVVGLLIEIAQIWIPHRQPGFWDFLGDMVGALLFLALFCRRRDDRGGETSVT